MSRAFVPVADTLVFFFSITQKLCPLIPPVLSFSTKEDVYTISIGGLPLVPPPAQTEYVDPKIITKELGCYRLHVLWSLAKPSYFRWMPYA